MRGNRIDFISEYCDRWCERCAFTSRCSAYAVKIALGMCNGDYESALELAVGAPPPMTAGEVARREAFLARLPGTEPTEQEIAKCEREEENRRERIDELQLTTMSRRAMTLAHHWVRANEEQPALAADPLVAEALQIAGWDACFIGAKLHRALMGRDRYLHDEDVDDDPVQNDWNGSAKVALISIVRSIAAWATLAETTGDPEALELVKELQGLQQEVEHVFPDARGFVRPGFDDPSGPTLHRADFS